MPTTDITLSIEMIEHAKSVVEDVRVRRTVASPIDTLAGLLGELAFAEWFLGDWRQHDLRNTKGRPDFINRIEVKTSAFPFRETLNLLVREDYAASRKPDCYVQTIIDTPDRFAAKIEAGWKCRLSGWATASEVDAAPLRDFGSKGGGRGGYRCHYIQIRHLRPMSEFPFPRMQQTPNS
jgi:hypothetical protein